MNKDNKEFYKFLKNKKAKALFKKLILIKSLSFFWIGISMLLFLITQDVNWISNLILGLLMNLTSFLLKYIVILLDWFDQLQKRVEELEER